MATRIQSIIYHRVDYTIAFCRSSPKPARHLTRATAQRLVGYLRSHLKEWAAGAFEDCQVNPLVCWNRREARDAADGSLR